MNDALWIAAGIMAAMVGSDQLERTRRRGSPSSSGFLFSILSGYFAHNHPELRDGGEVLRLAWYSLTFCALSPALGFILWGNEGKYLVRLLRWCLAAILASVTWLVASQYLGPGKPSMILAAVMGLLVVFPFGATRKAIATRKQRQQTQQEEAQRHQEELAAAERQRRVEAKQEELLEAMIADLRDN